MTFTDAAAEVLRLVGRPLHYKEITDIAIEKNLLSHVGKSPEVTMGARLAAMLKKDSPENPLVRVKPGVFALREWDEKTIKAGLEGKKGKRGKPDGERPREEEEEVAPVESAEVEAAADGDEARAADEAPAVEVEGEDDEAADIEADLSDLPPGPSVVEARVEARAPSSPRPSRPVPESYEEEEAGEPAGPDDIMRAEAAAGAAEMFDEEDDDDQPILGAVDERAAPGGADLGDGRRRRRRRRRGRTTEGPATPQSGSGQGGLPSYTATPAYDRDRNGGRDQARDQAREQPREQPIRERESARELAAPDLAYRGPQVIDLTGGDAHALDDLAGKDLADAIAALLGTFDRNAGAVSLRHIADAAQRRGRLQGDVQLVQSQIAAAIRADNARRLAAGQRQRFRFAGGRVALTDWLLSSDLSRYEQEALAAVERYREAARRAFARKLGELPGHAFIEVCMLALERAGISQLRAIRRAGAPGGEAHFGGSLRTLGDDIRVAVVIRRDGREVGRERVTELRGALHHYGPATAGWILTSGQVLSGAREEASVAGAAPIQIFDGLGVARLCEEHDVAVLRARLPIAIPDVDLLEALRAS